MKILLLFVPALFVLRSGIAQSVNSKIADNALQPSVAINPKNHLNIVIGCGTGQLSYSTDGGASWQQGKAPFSASKKGESLLLADSEGEFFLFHNNDYTDSINKETRLLVHTSRSGGKSWSSAVAIGTPGKSKYFPAVSLHPKKGKVAAVWVESDQLRSTDPSCQSLVYLSQSGDGVKWSQPDLLSQAAGDCADNSLQSPVVLFDDEHKIYAGWLAKEIIVMDRSFDAGKTWLNNDISGFKAGASKEYSIPGIGLVTRRVQVIQNNSKSAYKNTIYAVWSDQRNGKDDTDIWFTTSVRRGDMWSSPTRVNQDEKGKHQFLPAIAVDDVTGVIYMVYYDRRNYSDNQTDVYLAWSTSGGARFTEKKISETPFTPEGDKPFTDYIAIAAHKGTITPVWVRVDGGVSSVWSVTIKQQDLFDRSELPQEMKPPANGLKQKQQRQSWQN